MTTYHYDDVIMTMLASQITSLPVVCSIVYSDVNQRKHQSSASLAFVREIHRGPVNFPHKWPVTRKMFPFDDVIMIPMNSREVNVQSWDSWVHYRSRKTKKFRWIPLTEGQYRGMCFHLMTSSCVASRCPFKYQDVVLLRNYHDEDTTVLR